MTCCLWFNEIMTNIFNYLQIIHRQFSLFSRCLCIKFAITPCFHELSFYFYNKNNNTALLISVQMFKVVRNSTEIINGYLCDLLIVSNPSTDIQTRIQTHMYRSKHGKFPICNF